MSEWLFVPDEIRAINGLVEDWVKHLEKIQRPRGYNSYHPSAMGKCLRQMQYYRYAELGYLEMPESQFDGRMLRLFEKGHNMQSRWERYFTDMGVLRGIWKCNSPHCRLSDNSGKIVGVNDSICVDDLSSPRIYGDKDKLGSFKPDRCVCGSKDFSYHEVSVKDYELNIGGNVDFILDFSKFSTDIFKESCCNFDPDHLPKSPIVVDMKTCGKWSWDNQVIKSGPHLAYQVQIMIYTNLLGCEYGIIIYENKNDSHVKAFKIPKKSDTWFETVKKQLKMMNEMVEFKKLPPPRNLDKSDFECSKCPFAPCCHASKIWDSRENLQQKRKAFYGDMLSAK